MRRPALPKALSVLTCVLVALVGVTTAQQGQPPTDPGVSLWVQFVADFAITLVVGAIVLLVVPDASDRITNRVRTQPGESFLYGLLVGIAAIIVSILLAITIIGLVIVIPGLIVFAIIGIAGTVLATIALGLVLISEPNPWFGLVVGGLIVALVSVVPFLGGLVHFIIATVGLGAIVIDYRSDDTKSNRPSSRRGIDPTDRSEF